MFKRSFSNNIYPFILSIFSGVILSFCYPPFEIGNFVWVFQIPLFVAIWIPRLLNEKVKICHRKSFFIGGVSGFIFFLINLFWLNELSHVVGSMWGGIVALLSLSLYLSIYFSIFSIFISSVGRYRKEYLKGGKYNFCLLYIAVINSAMWCGLEWLRGIVFTGFSWNTLGVSLKDNLLLIQFADVIGINGYGFIITFINHVIFFISIKCIYKIINKNSFRTLYKLPIYLFAALCMIAFLILYGNHKVKTIPKDTISLSIKLVQPNISYEDKLSRDLVTINKVFNIYDRLTELDNNKKNPDIIVWPETALPGNFHDKFIQEYLNNRILNDDFTYLFAGLELLEGESMDFYNSFFILNKKTDNYKVYKKHHLVPFGEYIPFRKKLSYLDKIFKYVLPYDITKGESFKPLTIKKNNKLISIVPLICFEDTVSWHARKLIRKVPQFIVNISNDGWFNKSHESLQHFNNSIFRCIEFRRPMVRSSNTGVSGFIDEWGRYYYVKDNKKYYNIIKDKENGSTHIEGVLFNKIKTNMNPYMSFYTKYGNVFSFIMLSISLISVLIHIKKKNSY